MEGLEGDIQMTLEEERKLLLEAEQEAEREAALLESSDEDNLYFSRPASLDPLVHNELGADEVMESSDHDSDEGNLYFSRPAILDPLVHNELGADEVMESSDDQGNLCFSRSASLGPLVHHHAKGVMCVSGGQTTSVSGGIYLVVFVRTDSTDVCTVVRSPSRQSVAVPRPGRRPPPTGPTPPSPDPPMVQYLTGKRKTTRLWRLEHKESSSKTRTMRQDACHGCFITIFMSLYVHLSLARAFV